MTPGPQLRYYWAARASCALGLFKDGQAHCQAGIDVSTPPATSHEAKPSATEDAQGNSTYNNSGSNHSVNALLALRDKCAMELFKQTEKKKLRLQERLESAAEDSRGGVTVWEILKVRGIALSDETTYDATGAYSTLPSLVKKAPLVDDITAAEEWTLEYPILFLYDEHLQSDYVRAVKETDLLERHLQALFPGGLEYPGWDLDKKYSWNGITLYLELPAPSQHSTPMIKLSSNAVSVSHLLQSAMTILCGNGNLPSATCRGTPLLHKPGFIVLHGLRRGSRALKAFERSHQIVIAEG
eukprot:Filipodium_phascolosomae@DN6987_c0_g1_i1.p1